MLNEIIVDVWNCGSFFGPLAQPYAYKPELRKVISSLHKAAIRSTNRHFVLEGTVTRAAQSTREGALAYMGEGMVLVSMSGLKQF